MIVFLILMACFGLTLTLLGLWFVIKDGKRGIKNNWKQR